ncbi:MAG: DAK2 domain-containing protein [Actinobacteria bacterium]|nr:MAG: DAK2 domain-containing protein [Actinomycetota bacterium]
MTGRELATVLDAALARLVESCDELRDLDAALGDGDLGITVRKGSDAVRAKLAELEDPAPAEVLRAAGAAFANANPSTLAALVGGGLLAAAKTVADAGELGAEEARRIGRAAADSIAARGKAEPGDKTILDAVLPSLDALDGADGDALPAMIDAARCGVEETMPLQSQRGRAAWLNERSKGNADAGATAYVRFLESLAASL